MLVRESKVNIAVNAALLTIAGIVVLLRILARRIQRVSLEANDFTIIVAMIVALANSILSIYSSSRDIYAETLDRDQGMLRNKTIFVNVILTHIVYGLIKISLLLLYKRLFPVRWLLITSNIFMVLVTLWVISLIVGICRSVQPLYYFWTKLLPPSGFPRFDFQYYIFLYTICAIDFSMDIFIILLPMTIISSLKVNRKKKILLVFIFGVGIFCIVATILRFYYSLRVWLIHSGKINPKEGYDTAFLLDLWATIETYVSVIGACLPTLAPVVAKGSPILSFFTSVRSMIYSRGRSQSSEQDIVVERISRQESSSDLVPGRNEWYKLQTRSNAEYLAKSSLKTSKLSNSIHIQQSFGSYNET